MIIDGYFIFVIFASAFISAFVGWMMYGWIEENRRTKRERKTLD